MRWFTFLIITAIILASPVYSAESSLNLNAQFTDIKGSPIPADKIQYFMCIDMQDEPIVSQTEVKDGLVTALVPKGPVQMSAMIEVPGFGEVMIYADNKGKGYTQSGNINFVADAAQTRLLRVKKVLQKARQEGVKIPQALTDKLASAEKALSYDSLAATLAVGEELTMLRARHRISKQKNPRPEFLFGCNAFGNPKRGPEYDRRYKELFNFGTANMYLTGFAPAETTRNYSRTDEQTAWLQSMGMKVKPCAPFYLAGGITPEWLKQKPWPEVKKICYDTMLEMAKRYRGKFDCVEITNEAAMSNSLKLSSEQLVELTDISSKATREGDPNVKRIINSAHMWGDYAAKLDKQGRPRYSPYAYVRACIKAGVQFEVVGVQLYYPDYDLMEIDRMLDRFAKLGKPIHITELGCSSASGPDPNAQRKKITGLWHGPWTEDIQADWVESVYTIFYSKPYIEAITWWDLADAVSFWPYGGLLKGDCSPKPSYLRLVDLLNKWGYKAGAGGQGLGVGD